MVSSVVAYLALSCRVRSIIMLQEKAQDRERLLLKFIKIMKVTDSMPRAFPVYLGRLEPQPYAIPTPSLTNASPHSTCASSTISTRTWPSSQH